MKLFKRGGDLAETKLKMTSMIDIVFLLIIFFMCVTEMSKLEAEAVTLPEAKKARDDSDPPKDRVVINVMRDGTYRVMRTTYSKSDLRNFLIKEAIRTRGQDGLSTLAVKIRADADAAYKYVQRIMMFCMDPKARIWKISFGVAQKHEVEE
jgi:biopolymer transport protein ExbD